jgi:hypothetical protein
MKIQAWIKVGYKLPAVLVALQQHPKMKNVSTSRNSRNEVQLDIQYGGSREVSCVTIVCKF